MGKSISATSRRAHTFRLPRCHTPKSNAPCNGRASTERRGFSLERTNLILPLRTTASICRIVTSVNNRDAISGLVHPGRTARKNSWLPSAFTQLAAAVASDPGMAVESCAAKNGCGIDFDILLDSTHAKSGAGSQRRESARPRSSAALPMSE